MEKKRRIEHIYGHNLLEASGGIIWGAAILVAGTAASPQDCRGGKWQAEETRWVIAISRGEASVAPHWVHGGRYQRTWWKRMGSLILVSRARSENTPFTTCLGSTGPGMEPTVSAHPSTLTASSRLGFHPPACKVWCYVSPAKRWSGRPCRLWKITQRGKVLGTRCSCHQWLLGR